MTSLFCCCLKCLLNTLNTVHSFRFASMALIRLVTQVACAAVCRQTIYRADLTMTYCQSHHKKPRSADESNGKLWHWSHAMQMIVADSAKMHSAVRRYRSVIWLCCTVWPLKMRLYKLLKSSSRTLVCWEFYIAIFKISKNPIKCVSQCQSLGILVYHVDFNLSD